MKNIFFYRLKSFVISATIFVLLSDIVLFRNLHLRLPSFQYYEPNAADGITVLSLIGERSSGTKWIHRELQQCFNHTLRIKKGIVRQKHWFQYDDGRNHSRAVVIAMFRNPYDWTAAMVDKPHHAPAHFDLGWREFLKKPWTMERDEPNNNNNNNVTTTALFDNSNVTDDGRVCQDNFRYNEVISCSKFPHPDEYYTWQTRFSEQNPVYELRNDGSGLPYENILELRADKIRNFFGTANYSFVDTLLAVQYEALLLAGTGELIREIEEITGVEAKCDITPPDDDRRRSRQRMHDPQFVKYLNRNLDWKAEALAGYRKGTLNKVDNMTILSDYFF